MYHPATPAEHGDPSWLFRFWEQIARNELRPGDRLIEAVVGDLEVPVDIEREPATAR